MAALEKLGYPADPCFITHAALRDQEKEAVRIYSGREEVYAYGYEDYELYGSTTADPIAETEPIPVYSEAVTP